MYEILNSTNVHIFYQPIRAHVQEAAGIFLNVFFSRHGRRERELGEGRGGRNSKTVKL